MFEWGQIITDYDYLTTATVDRNQGLSLNVPGLWPQSGHGQDSQKFSYLSSSDILLSEDIT